MTDAAPSPLPPKDLDALQDLLVELALGGMLEKAPKCHRWLEGAGIAQATDDEHLTPTEDWLSCSLPASSPADLLTRTLLRDPLYRLHVDVLVTEVVAAVGSSGRWQRLEDLLFGDLASLAPRVSALLDSAQPPDQPARPWSEIAWRALDPLPREVSGRLDERCWGVSGSAAAMFPILRTRYPRLASVPVFIDTDDAIIGATIVAAASGEAVRLPRARRTELVEWLYRGVPLWWRPLADGSLEITLSSPCRARSQPGDAVSQPFSRGVPELARSRSAVVPSESPGRRAAFWEIVEESHVGLAFAGAESGNVWPGDDIATRRGLPRRRQLLAVGGARPSQRGEPDLPADAIRRLAEHPLFGFWLQVLLLEALDRELGDETVLLAPPTHALVDDVAGTTRVYYRPRPGAENDGWPALELGPLDEVMTQVAAALGVRTVGVLGKAFGPWSMGLALLATVGLAQTRHDRWTLSAHALDRLHGGGLMTGVIRRGKEFRERLHDVLEGLWLQHCDSQAPLRGDESAQEVSIA